MSQKLGQTKLQDRLHNILKIQDQELDQQVRNSHSFLNQDTQQFAGKRWSTDENVKFCLFMTFYQEIFSKKRDRQCGRVFKKFSNILGNRTPRQCRSHFQKMMLRFKTPNKACSFYRKLLGEKMYEERFQALSKELQKLQIHSKQNYKKKSAESTDFGVQVDMKDDSVYGHQSWDSVMGLNQWYWLPMYGQQFYPYYSMAPSNLSMG